MVAHDEGRMTDELHQYRTNRTAWLQTAGTRMAKMIEQRSDEWVNETWSMIATDYRAAVWAHLDAAQRDRVKRLRKEAA